MVGLILGKYNLHLLMTLKQSLMSTQMVKYLKYV